MLCTDEMSVHGGPTINKTLEITLIIILSVFMLRNNSNAIELIVDVKVEMC